MGMFDDKDNIYSAISPLFYLCKILGIAPVNCVIEHYEPIARRTDGPVEMKTMRYRTSRAWTIYSVLVSLAITVSYCLFVKWGWEVTSSQLGTTRFATLMTLFMGFLIQLSVSLAIPVTGSWKNIDKVLTNITRADKILCFVKKDYQNAYITVFMKTTILMLTLAGVNQMERLLQSNASIDHLIEDILGRQLGFVICCVTTFQLIVLLAVLKQRYVRLNLRLETISESYMRENSRISSPHAPYATFYPTDSYVSYSDRNAITASSGTLEDLNEGGRLYLNARSTRYESVSWTERIGKLREAHALLFDAVNQINALYGFQILLDFAINMVVLSKQLYSLTVMIFLSISYKETSSVLAIIVTSFYILIAAVKAVSVTFSCGGLRDEARRTMVVLQKMTLLPRPGSAAMDEIQLFMQQVTYKRLRLSACGLFDMDRGMLCSLASAAITYYVVLVQIQLMNK